MSTAQEHKMKYDENLNILNTLFDARKREHCNWIATISFYTVLHKVEARLAREKRLHSHDHKNREQLMENSGLFTSKEMAMYKQLRSNSHAARYLPQNISPTIANQMKLYADRFSE